MMLCHIIPQLLLLFDIDLQLMVVNLQKGHNVVHHLDADQQRQDLFARLHRRLGAVVRRQQAHAHETGQQRPNLVDGTFGQLGHIQVLHGREGARTQVGQVHGAAGCEHRRLEWLWSVLFKLRGVWRGRWFYEAITVKGVAWSRQIRSVILRICDDAPTI